MDEFTEYLEKNKIVTRNVFAGNLLRHPGYINIRSNFKVIGKMTESDIVMNDAFWIGVWPGIDKRRLVYMMHKINDFMVYNSDI